MKLKLTTVVIVILASGGMVTGQAPSEPMVQPPSQKSLAATLNVYAFPTAGQTPEQQSKDEGACYNWAVQNTGTDPFNLQKQAQQQQQQTQQKQEEIAKAGKGAGAKGAVGGAAAGALIGEIASEDVGKAAAYGAAAGLLIARRRARMAQAQAGAEVQQQAQQTQQATAQQEQNFKKAFSVCLEAKNYMVKY